MRFVITNYKSVEAFDPMHEAKRDKFVQSPIDRKRCPETSVTNAVKVENLICAQRLTGGLQCLRYNVLISRQIWPGERNQHVESKLL